MLRALRKVVGASREGERLVLETLAEDVREPCPVLGEETGHLAAHRLGQRHVFGSQNPAMDMRLRFSASAYRSVYASSLAQALGRS